LGVSSGGKISRYEKFSRFPPPLTIFALEVVFGAAACDLFAGIYGTVRHAVRTRARKLVRHVARLPQTGRTARKLALLKTIVETKPTNTANP
jgi:hypothetical protein